MPPWYWSAWKQEKPDRQKKGLSYEGKNSTKSAYFSQILCYFSMSVAVTSKEVTLWNYLETAPLLTAVFA